MEILGDRGAIQLDGAARRGALGGSVRDLVGAFDRHVFQALHLEDAVGEGEGVVLHVEHHRFGREACRARRAGDGDPLHDLCVMRDERG